MRDEYDFSSAKKNPYTKNEKQQITIKLDSKVVSYFKETARQSGMPYHTLINLYLSDCAEKNLKPEILWHEK